MLEHIQADIWVRYKKLIGYNNIWFICADDSHGTAIMLNAKELNISPNVLISDIFYDHLGDFSAFNISYDYFSSTHHIENMYFLHKVYYQLKLKKLIKVKSILQLYDTKENIFLPDRFVRGTCPNCFSKNQYGDNCSSCGAIYQAEDLINPISSISYTIPVMRSSAHIFLDLKKLQTVLFQWIQSGVMYDQIVNHMKTWFKKDLKNWNISRDLPYFGFQVPDMLNKYFYVWLDATIAYISTFKQFCRQNNSLNFHEFWKEDSKTELYHFIGKDIIYFHALFWPAILEGMNFRKPTKIFVHGHVTLKGIKFSKSKNNSITIKNWLKYFDSDSLRYYYASKLSANIEDIEFDIQDFVYKINSDIVNKIVNLAARSASFLNKYFDSVLSKEIENHDLYNHFVSLNYQINNFFHNGEFHLVIKHVIQLADLANQYINDKKPWNIVIKKGNRDLQNICSMGINLFRIIMIYLKPIIPDISKKSELFLLNELSWNNLHIPLINHRIAIFKPLYTRINIIDINDLMI